MVRYETRDRTVYVTLDRPEVRNAIDPAMHDELCRIWRDFRDDDTVDVAGAIIHGSDKALSQDEIDDLLGD